MVHRRHWLSLAVLALAAQAQAQTAPAASDEGKKLERVEVTGSLIKRTDRETPSVVQTISKDEIRNSGYASVEELLRATGAVDTSSIGDGAASGFVGGVSTISLRGFGSQGTLVLINGRRIAPVAAVDVNFGRGTLQNVNTIPKGLIERVEVLKDGASALYGSDAMAGVINYVLKKDYQGLEATAQMGANERGVGKNHTAGVTFGVGNIDTQRFNIFGGLEAYHRDAVMYSELKNVGSLDTYNQFRNLNGNFTRFTPDSVASLYSNYYRVPASLAGSTTIPGAGPNGGSLSVANNSPFGVNFLGSLPGCPDELRVGAGVKTRPDGLPLTSPSLPNGMCRFNLDNADQAITKQDRVSGMLRGNFALTNDLMAYADLMVTKTKTIETGAPRVLTTALVSSANPTATTWPMLDGTFKSQRAIILPIGHPDNPTNGTANAQAVQLIPRFEDLPTDDINDLKTLRFVAGVEGNVAGWDIDSAVMLSRIDSTRTQKGSLRSSLLTAAVTNGTYRFGRINDAAALATIASDAVNEGESKVTAFDLRGSRELFDLGGGKAAIALGAEARREELAATPDANYLAGDYIGLVANGAKGKRNSFAAYSELSLPFFKTLEAQAALRAEHYSDFGNSTTGKLGFKWSALPSTLAFRGTVATGFRAPSLSQIGDSFVSSFHSFGSYRVVDSLRCDTTNPNAPVSRANPSNNRDCNVLGYASATPNPGSIPSVIAANPNLKPETSKSATLGLLFSPTDYLDIAIDAWYFHRDDEIRAQRGVDIMERYNANPADAAAAAALIRDPNPTSWLPGVANSGPILAIVRQYGNFNWTKTSGIDYEANLRLPAIDIGKFGIVLKGTYTSRYDQKILAAGAVDRLVGTSTSDIAKTKAQITLTWKKDDYGSWLRFNHQDGVITSTTASCMAATAPTTNPPAPGTNAGNYFLQQNGWCKVNSENTLDFGVSYSGFKGLSLAATVLNVANNYARSSGAPSAFTYWDPGSSPQLGRRFSLSASYTYK